MTPTNERASRKMSPLQRVVWLAAIACLLLSATPAHAATRLIVRVQTGLPGVQLLCRLLGCTVQYNLGDPLGQVFLVTAPNLLPLQLVIALPGVLDAEIDQVGKTLGASYSGTVPPALLDSTPVNYYGTTVREGYVQQPAAQLINLAAA